MWNIWSVAKYFKGKINKSLATKKTGVIRLGINVEMSESLIFKKRTACLENRYTRKTNCSNVVRNGLRQNRGK